MNKPDQLVNVDLTKLRNLVGNYIKVVEKGNEAETLIDEYILAIFDTSVKMFYGENIFDWVNNKTSNVE